MLDRQLSDVANFCASEIKFVIMTIDPTFSLGEFDVTVTTYQHLLLQSRRTSNHPIFIGPVMVHYKKSCSAYMFFGSTLLGMRQQLSTLKCFGNDGEEALYGAFEHVFPGEIHYTHETQCESKLQELSVPDNIQQVVLGVSLENRSCLSS